MKKRFFFIMATALFCQGAVAREAGNYPMKIKILFDDKVVRGELNDLAPARELASKLPLTLEMYKHQNREFYASIKLDKKGVVQNGYQVGDIGYWTDGNTLVLFYGPGDTDGLIIMGRITQGIDVLSHMGEHVSVRIEVD